MKPRGLLLCTVMLGLLATTQAPASVTLAATRVESAYTGLGGTPVTGGSFGGQISIYRTSGPNVPTTTTASVQLVICDPNCSYPVFTQQQVPNAVLDMDPIGNSATINLTIADTNNIPHTFALTMKRPSYLLLNIPPWVMPSLNFWLDGTAAGASVLAFPNIFRQGYEVTGLIDGSLVIEQSGMSATYNALSLGADVMLP